jgi:hypothetical protein
MCGSHASWVLSLTWRKPLLLQAPAHSAAVIIITCGKQGSKQLVLFFLEEEGLHGVHKRLLLLLPCNSLLFCLHHAAVA